MTRTKTSHTPPSLPGSCQSRTPQAVRDSPSQNDAQRESHSGGHSVSPRPEGEAEEGRGRGGRGKGMMLDGGGRGMKEPREEQAKCQPVISTFGDIHELM